MISLIRFILFTGASSSWSYGSWIYNYLGNQCLSPLTLWVRNPFRWGVLDPTLCDKVCQWLAAGGGVFPGIPVSLTNKTDSHDINEILLNVALNTITLPYFVYGSIFTFIFLYNFNFVLWLFWWCRPSIFFNLITIISLTWSPFLISHSHIATYQFFEGEQVTDLILLIFFVFHFISNKKRSLTRLTNHFPLSI